MRRVHTQGSCIGDDVTVEEHITDAKHGCDGPSNAMEHMAAGRSQTVLRSASPDGVGRGIFDVGNSMLDDGFGGGLDNNFLTGEGRVEDEIGHRGTLRRTETERRQAELERANTLDRGFIATRFYGR
jgi:hypothetical protein